MDDGQIAFYGRTGGPPTQQGVYLYDIATDTLSVVADLNTPAPGDPGNFTSVTRRQGPAVSDGRVVFYGEGTMTAGLYIFNGRTLRPVVNCGDMIDGQVAMSFFIYRQGLSGNNLAFIAQLLDGAWPNTELAVYVARLPLPGDADGDEDVDLDDHQMLFDCFGPPGSAPNPTPPTMPQECLDPFDSDSDGDTDLFDFAEFQVAFTQGP